MDFISDLDAPLLRLSARDHFTLRDAVTGVHAFGGIGSGKSSGLAKTLSSAYLRAGMGGIVMTAKPDEIGLWKEYARQNGRSSSLVVFDESKGFNFLAHAMSMHGAAGVGSVIEILMAVLDAADRASGTGGKESEAFWSQSIAQLLQYAVPLLHAAHGTVSVSSLISFVTTAATTRGEQYFEPAFVASSFAGQTLTKAVRDPAVRLPQAELNTLLGYWFVQYPAIAEKTRANIVISLTARLDRFLHGRLRDAFCGKTDIVPEMTFGGAVIILAMPALTWQADGVVAQMTFKHALQKSVEARNSLSEDQRQRPIFIFCDEAHYFASAYDDTFLSTCRSSRACMVWLSQNLPSYYARLGKEKTDAVDGMIGKFSHQVFFASMCNRTNQMASQMIGKGIQWRANQSSSQGSNQSRGMNEGSGSNAGVSSGGGASWAGGAGPSTWNHSSNNNSTTGSSENQGVNVGRGTNESRTVGGSEAMDLIVEPNVFSTQLKTGGPMNDHKTTAIWVRSGGTFKDGFTPNALRVTFRQ